jgi:hypothetical protein
MLWSQAPGVEFRMTPSTPSTIDGTRVHSRPSVDVAAHRPPVSAEVGQV